MFKFISEYLLYILAFVLRLFSTEYGVKLYEMVMKKPFVDSTRGFLTVISILIGTFIGIGTLISGFNGWLIYFHPAINSLPDNPAPKTPRPDQMVPATNPPEGPMPPPGSKPAPTTPSIAPPIQAPELLRKGKDNADAKPHIFDRSTAIFLRVSSQTSPTYVDGVERILSNFIDANHLSLSDSINKADVIADVVIVDDGQPFIDNSKFGPSGNAVYKSCPIVNLKAYWADNNSVAIPAQIVTIKCGMSDTMNDGSDDAAKSARNLAFSNVATQIVSIIEQSTR